MGQKIHPKGLRLGIIEEWDSFWYSGKQGFARLLKEDYDIRKHLKYILFRAGIARIKITRKANQVQIDIYSAKPGLIIGRGGKEIAAVRDDLIKRVGKQVQLDVHEEKNPDANALLLAESIAAQLEKRISFRRAMKQGVSRAMRAGAKGVKLMVAGRLGGSEIARTEKYRLGRVPLHTLRARIDYGFTEAMTMYGKIGVKCWIYKGEVLPTVTVKEKEKVVSGTGTGEN